MISEEQCCSYYMPLVRRMARVAYRKSCFQRVYEVDDFAQEGAICIIHLARRNMDTVEEIAPLVFVAVRNRFTTILKAEKLRCFVPLEAVPDIPQPKPLFDPGEFDSLANRLSPLGQQVLWCLVDPPGSLFDLIAVRRARRISRRILAEYFQVDPRRVSGAFREIQLLLE